MERFLQIDDEGFFALNGARITDNKYAQFLFENLTRAEDNGRYITKPKPGSSETITVEAFNQPLVVQQIHKQDDENWNFTLPHNYTGSFNLNKLSVDEWDRFHSLSDKNIPLVFSNKAQADFFNLVDEFDDESVTVNKVKYPVKDFFIDNPSIADESFWTEIYNSEDPPGWELNQANPLLIDTLPQLKIPKSRIIVLGCGSGNDAAYLASLGHIVTGVDMSPQAISQAKEKYGQVKNLNFIQSNIFELGDKHIAQYDIVFEHTCYCAIPPKQRNKLVKTWRRLLNEGGMLLGVFFIMNKTSGPPFGGSEWELRQRLDKDFQFLYWTRARNSIEKRHGKELIIFAKKKG